MRKKENTRKVPILYIAALAVKDSPNNFTIQFFQ